jgi:TolA-binding protein
MSNHLEYWINSAAWFLGGCVGSSVYWRVYVHRKLVAVGAAKKEQPLSVFVACLVGVAMVIGLLFSESSRLALGDYVKCQATVTQHNNDVITDGRKKSDSQLRAQIAQLRGQIATLRARSNHALADLIGQDQALIENDQRLLETHAANPLRPISDCKKESSS